MAERRMFTKQIIDSDAFLDMPQSSQNLYFHLCMRADDDGFLNNPKKISRSVGCGDDDLKILLSKRFIIAFESGVIVIKHWRMHNYIAKDRYKETVYQDEKSRLTLKENGAYTDCIQDVDSLMTQVRLGKDRLGEESKGKSIEPASAVSTTKFSKPTLDQVAEYCQERGNTVDPQRFIDHYESVGWKVGRSAMKDWRASVRTWEKNEKPVSKPKKRLCDDCGTELLGTMTKCHSCGSLEYSVK